VGDEEKMKRGMGDKRKREMKRIKREMKRIKRNRENKRETTWGGGGRWRRKWRRGEDGESKIGVEEGKQKRKRDKEKKER